MLLLTQCVLEAPRADDVAHVPLVFVGRNAGALHALLVRHREEEVPVFLSGFGAEAQLALLRSRVLVVGAGGLGAPVLTYLAAAGVGHLTIIDDDVVDAEVVEDDDQGKK